DHVAARDLPRPLLLLRRLQKAGRLLRRRLRGRVLPLRRDEPVVAARDGDAEPALRDLQLRLRDRLERLRAPQRRRHDDVRRQLLACDAPGAIHLHAVERDEAPVGVDAVRRVPEELRRIAERGEQAGARLHAIVARDGGVADRRLKLAVVLLRALQRVLQRDCERRPRRARGLHERQGRTDRRLILRRNDRRRQEQRGGRERPPGDRQRAHLPTTRTLNVFGRYDARPPPVDGAVFAVGRYTLCVFSSTAIVRAPRSVAMFSRTSHLPPVCWTTVSVPSPFELNAKPVAESNAAPSEPAPIAGVATTLPASGSEIAITRFEQTENRRRLFASMARPDGPSH